MIKLIDIGKQYSNYKIISDALIGVNFTIKENDFVTIYGPSGSGKSTLLNIIGLLDFPTSGKMIFNDKDIFSSQKKELSKIRMENISYIFQSFNLIQIISAYDNIEYPLLMKKISREKRKKIIYEVAESVGVSHLLKNKPYEMSGGQQQRVAIARAIACAPSIIVADEPTANLDSNTGQQIINLFSDLNKNSKTTLIVATHDSRFIACSSRVAKILDGKLYERK